MCACRVKGSHIFDLSYLKVTVQQRCSKKTPIGMVGFIVTSNLAVSDPRGTVISVPYDKKLEIVLHL